MNSILIYGFGDFLSSEFVVNFCTGRVCEWVPKTVGKLLFVSVDKIPVLLLLFLALLEGSGFFGLLHFSVISEIWAFSNFLCT